MKIAEALQVSTDRILRADIPGTVVVLNRDTERILDGRSADELNDVMLILTDIKRSVKRAKCIAVCVAVVAACQEPPRAFLRVL